jgi:hypothetical protein
MQHKLRTKAEWLRIFDEQCENGLTIKAFCEHNCIHLQTFRARNDSVNQQWFADIVKVLSQ